MSHCRSGRRTQVDELSVQAVEGGEPIQGLTTRNLMDPPSTSVDPQQSPEVLTPEHPDELHAQAYGPQTVLSWVQSPLRVAGPSNTATQGLSPSRLAGASGTVHQELWQNLGDAPSDPDHVSPDGGDTDEEENFTIPASEDNTEIVLSEAMKVIERLNTVFKCIRTPMNRMSLRMKELFIALVKKCSGKTCEPGNNWAHDKAAAKAATERIMVQTAIMEPVPGTGTDDRARLTQSHIPRDGDRHSLPLRQQNSHETIPHTAQSKQSGDSQPQRGCDVHTIHNLSTDKAIQGVPESIEHFWHSIREPQSIDMNALREEIKETISATIKEKLHLDADSVTTVSQSILALDPNTQYWSNLSNKAARHSMAIEPLSSNSSWLKKRLIPFYTRKHQKRCFWRLLGKRELYASNKTRTHDCVKRV
ncbi:hypothetical protein M422DRAFT_238845 [Sphaerobolus stellatus SS14]|nr:hypothetical protein M422DRAFT_238845 [Sphaerobolus stellatus SS14]